MEKLQRVKITKAFLGIVHMQVCVVDDASDEEILEFCNCNNAAGATNAWTKVIRDSEEGPFAPVKCMENEGRTHLVVGS
tara:strand:+ start:138 stop:374 length:237 start_codon:yes stop_codon:yes gene_type:complete